MQPQNLYAVYGASGYGREVMPWARQQQAQADQAPHQQSPIREREANHRTFSGKAGHCRRLAPGRRAVASGAADCCCGESRRGRRSTGA